MKKLALTLACSGMAMLGMAQDPWTNKLNEFDPSLQPKLGTSNDVPLDFYTKGVKRMSLGTDGNLKLSGFANADIKEERFLILDGDGTIRALEVPPLSINCSPGAAPWVKGGNSVFGNNQNLIGTCNDVPFILKAYNNPAVYVQPNSLVGIGNGNSSPLSALDVMGQSHFRIFADAAGNVESTTDMNLNYKTGGAFFINEGSWLTSLNNRLTVVGGRVGINSAGPSSTLEVRDNGQAEAHIISDAYPAAPAYVYTENAAQSYSFGTDGSGVGHIGIGSGTPINLINFKTQTGNAAQVWIGKRPTSGTHTNYNFAAEKIVAKEIYVFTTGGWADYVFDDSYQLPKLSEVESYYKENKHLPEIPSACEVEENGVSMGEMNKLLLKKVEELTLYVVQQQKEIEQLKAKVK